MLHIQSGPSRVLDTGVVTAFMGFPLRFELVHEQIRFRVELRFQTDPAVEGVDVGSEYIDGSLVLTCVNFDEADGRGSSRPVLLGEAGTDAVFLHFKVFRYGQTDDHTVHYTFFGANREAIGLQPA